MINDKLKETLLEDSKIIRLFCRLNANKRTNMPISSVEMEVLALIYHADNENNLTPLRLSQIMNLKKPSVSAIIDSLLKSEYIQKHKNINDKRSYTLTVTDEGKRLIKEINEVYLGSIYKLQTELGDDEFKVFLRTMKKANDILKEYIK